MSATYENDVPSDDSYVSRPGHKDEAVKVVSDDEPLETSGNAKNLDSDEQLVRDDKDAIDESNIIDDRTRGATQPKGTYTEPGDEEGLPTDDGTSSAN